MSLRGLVGINLITFGIHLHGYGFSTGICSLCIFKSNSFVKLTSSFTFVNDHSFSPSQLQGGLFFYTFLLNQHHYKRSALQTARHLAENSSPSASLTKSELHSCQATLRLHCEETSTSGLSSSHLSEWPLAGLNKIQNRKSKFYLPVFLSPRTGSYMVYSLSYLVFTGESWYLQHNI